MFRYITPVVLAFQMSVALGCDSRAIVDEQPSYYAWWLRIHFVPCDTAILGVPVNEIHRDWIRATPLKKENIPKSVLFTDGNDPLAASGKVFELSGDFNKDKKSDRALVGVYEDIKGQRGLFVAIFTQKAPPIWQLAYLDAYPEPSGILALKQGNSVLEMWSCMECGDVSELTWNNKTKKYVWVERKFGD